MKKALKKKKKNLFLHQEIHLNLLTAIGDTYNRSLHFNTVVLLIVQIVRLFFVIHIY